MVCMCASESLEMGTGGLQFLDVLPVCACVCVCAHMYACILCRDESGSGQEPSQTWVYINIETQQRCKRDRQTACTRVCHSIVYATGLSVCACVLCMCTNYLSDRGLCPKNFHVRGSAHTNFPIHREICEWYKFFAIQKHIMP